MFLKILLILDALALIVAVWLICAGPRVIAHLIWKYLRKRRIAWFCLAAVTLCTALVLVVISVMGGWLRMFEDSARGLTADIVIKGQSLSGFPYYQEMIDEIENDPRVVAAAPEIFTYGVVNIGDRKTLAVEVVGLPLDKIGKVNSFPRSLYRQYQKPIEEGKTPPAVPTWDVPLTAQVELDELPEDVPFDAATGAVGTGAIGTGVVETGAAGSGNPGLSGGVRYSRGRGTLSIEGPMTTEEQEQLQSLSGDKQWRQAVARLGNESRAPGIIPAAGVLDIKKGKDGKMTGRDPFKYRLWVKLTVVGIGTNQQLDEKAKAERTYRIADDSRTGMWQYDSRTVYVPFDVLQTDLGMDARPITRKQTVFSTNALVPARVLGTAPADGTYALHYGRSFAPRETVELKAGQPLGFRLTEGGGATAVAGERTLDVPSDPAGAVWIHNRPDIEPARASVIHVKLKDGVTNQTLYQTRDAIREMVRSIMLRHDPDTIPLDDPAVQSWEEASALYIGAIRKEKLLVTILFAFISIVAVFLVFCIFYMIVAEKTRDIGIIKSVGATSGGVAGIFLGYGLAIGVVGAGLGILVSYLIVHNINEIHEWLAARLQVVIWNPEIYAFDKIPNTMNATEVAVISSIAVLAAVVGAMVPALRAARLHPVEALRWE